MSFPIVVLISGNGSNLQAIIDKCHMPGNVDIKAVISDKSDAYGLVRAEAASIRPFVQPQYHFEEREEYCQILADTVACFRPELVVLAGFMKILTPNFIQLLPQTINIHPALLPKYKGLHTHKRVLEAGDREHGITIHWVTEELDSGPTILQRSLEIKVDDTVETLEHRIHELEHEWYPFVVNEIAAGRII